MFQIYVTWWVYIIKAILNHKVTPDQGPGSGAISLGVLWLSILWPPDAKNWLTGKDPDAGKDWRREEKGTTADEMVGWHHQLNGHEFEQAPWVGDGQGGLACCSPQGHKESDTTKRLNWTVTFNCWGQGKVSIKIGVCVIGDMSQTPHGQVWDQGHPGVSAPETPSLSPTELRSQEIWLPLRRTSWQQLLDPIFWAVPVLSVSWPSSAGSAVWTALPTYTPEVQSAACGLQLSPVHSPGKKEKILDLKDRLNIQTVDFEYGLQEKSHKVPFEQRELTYSRCGKVGEIKYTAYVTFISFSFNLQVMN